MNLHNIEQNITQPSWCTQQLRYDFGVLKHVFSRLRTISSLEHAHGTTELHLNSVLPPLQHLDVALRVFILSSTGSSCTLGII
jgi:hypothetical protein